MTRRLRIATRTSRLALWQTHHVADLLRARTPDLEIEFVETSTVGDRVRDRPLGQIGTFGLFTKELEAVILEGRADIAVHSLKDMETTLPDGLALLGTIARADPRDVLLTRDGAGLDALPQGGRVGTSSIRRRAQLAALRPDLEFVTIRGNVPTRIDKLKRAEDGIAATVLARAGLERLGLLDDTACPLAADHVVPAVGQGAIAIEGCSNDATVAALIQPIDHAPTRAAITAERSWLATLHGGCQVPAGALASVDAQGTLRMDGIIVSLDGAEVFRDQISGPADDAVALGVTLANALLERGADRIVAEVEATLRSSS